MAVVIMHDAMDSAYLKIDWNKYFADKYEEYKERLVDAAKEMDENAKKKAKKSLTKIEDLLDD